jgi:hypothetical protein
LVHPLHYKGGHKLAFSLLQWPLALFLPMRMVHEVDWAEESTKGCSVDHAGLEVEEHRAV